MRGWGSVPLFHAKTPQIAADGRFKNVCVLVTPHPPPPPPTRPIALVLSIDCRERGGADAILLIMTNYRVYWPNWLHPF